MIEYQESFGKRLSRRSRLLAGLLDGEKAQTGPFWVDFDVTRRCNLRCVGCLYHSPLVNGLRQPNPGVSDIAIDLVERTVKELARMGTHTVIIQGAGEPLMHPRIVDIITAVKRAGMFCRLLTNGTLLDGAMVERLIGAGLDSLRISIWANTAAEMHGANDELDARNFDSIVKGIRLVAEARAQRSSLIPQVELYQVVNRNNYRTVASLADLALKHHCAGIRLAQLITRRGQIDEYSLSPEEEKICLQQLAQVRPALQEQGVAHNIDGLAMRFEKGERVWDHAACFTPWYRLRVLVDGTVKVCRGHDEEFGHLERQSLSEIWNGAPLRAFRRRVASREGLARVAEYSDCRACCFFAENLRVENIYRWVRPLTVNRGNDRS